MANNLNYEISLMKNHQRVCGSFCSKVGINPYQLLLLRISKDFTDVFEVEHWLAKSEYASGEVILKWFNNQTDEKNYNINVVNRNVRQQLQIQRNLLEVKRTVGTRRGKIELNDKGLKLLKDWATTIKNFLENQDARVKDAESIAEKVERNTEQVKSEGENLIIDLDNLEEELVSQLKTDGEETYLQIVRSILTTREELQDPDSLTPIFFKVPEKIELSKEYTRRGICLIKGWIVAQTEIRELSLGRVFRCDKNEKHLHLETDPKESIDVCPTCHGGTKKVLNLTIPVREIHIETKKMDRIKALVHANLWHPSSSRGTEQKVVMFKMSDKFSQNVRGSPTASVNYLVVGIEKEEDISVNVDRAKLIADNSTADIINIIDNSILSDIAGLDEVKKSLIIGLGSINTQKLLIQKKGEWMKERGVINTLLWGVEGTGKSAVCRRITELVGLVHAKGMAGTTSAVGLTAGYDKEINAIRAGLLPMNDTRVCFIDELDKFNPNVFQRLLEPLEESVVHYNKAGFNVTYPARTVVFMAANNIKPITPLKNYDDGNELLETYSCLEQLKNEIDRHGGSRTPIIDRCDSIIVIREPVTGIDVLETWTTSSASKIFPKEDIKNYFESIRQITEVKIDNKAISSLIIEIKKSGYTGLAMRRLNSVLRIAGSIAKLHLRNAVTSTDVKEALHYFTTFIATIGEVTSVYKALDAPSKLDKQESIILELLRKGSFTSEELSSLVLDFDESVLSEISGIWKDSEQKWRTR